MNTKKGRKVEVITKNSDEVAKVEDGNDKKVDRYKQDVNVIDSVMSKLQQYSHDKDVTIGIKVSSNTRTVSVNDGERKVVKETNIYDGGSTTITSVFDKNKVTSNDIKSLKKDNTQNQIADKTGRSQSYISQKLKTKNK
ncbi:MAG: hypothetical protein Q4B63_08055 [Clostridium perfringens]|nr:hypothetical protein [Clostridium perfringens]